MLSGWYIIPHRKLLTERLVAVLKAQGPRAGNSLNKQKNERFHIRDPSGVDRGEQ